MLYCQISLALCDVRDHITLELETLFLHMAHNSRQVTLSLGRK